MNGIIGMTAIAKAHIGESERVLECLNKISGASDHLLSLVNKVLDISRIESGRMELSEKPFSLSELLDNLTGMLLLQADEKGQTLTINAENISHDRVVGDSLRLQQVFVNIVSNAIKYTEPGGKIILNFEEIFSHFDGFSEYRFVCEDNGCGMTPEFLERIFIPYERAAEHQNMTTQGTGLGMCIAKNIINMMDGTIDVRSEYGHGSTFTVVFRLRHSGEGEDNAEKITARPDNVLEKYSDIDFSDRHILLVEDNELNLEIASEVIGMTGAAMDFAENGSKAVSRFSDSACGYYDLILMDIQMPVMDGREASRSIRNLDRPDAAVVPIVAMSANAFTEDIELSKRAGMNDHISKPIDFAELLAVMQRYISDKK